MAYLEVAEPHLADDRRAAKIAFFAGNQFAKPISWATMAGNFGVPPGPPGDQRTLRHLPALYEAAGHVVPEHIRKRFMQ